MAKNKITVTIYGRNLEMEWDFPARWEICGACDGHAVTTRHVEADGGGLTQSEWEEACRECEDFAENYFSGVYDRPCPDCDGKGRVQVIDESRVTGWRDRIALKVHRKSMQDEADYNASCEMERRMGA